MDGCIARVNFPAPTLKAKIDEKGDSDAGSRESPFAAVAQLGGWLCPSK